MAKRREEIMERYQQIQEDLEPIIVLFENENVVAEISKNSNRPEALRDSLAPYGVSRARLAYPWSPLARHAARPPALASRDARNDPLLFTQFKEEMIDTLETCSKFYFQIGQYEEVRRPAVIVNSATKVLDVESAICASPYHPPSACQAATFLYNFRVLSTDADKNFSALWGKLASEILSEKWAEAEEDLNLLIEYIDGGASRVFLAKHNIPRASCSQHQISRIVFSFLFTSLCRRTQ
jgi:hypothetical protein